MRCAERDHIPPSGRSSGRAEQAIASWSPARPASSVAALAEALAGQGHEVTAMTRRPDELSRRRHAGGSGCRRTRRQMRERMAGQDAAYYLVHSLAESNFAEQGQDGSATSARRRTPAGSARSSTWAGWGPTGTTCRSTFAAGGKSRRSCATRRATTALRAGIVVGDGGISWEILRQLVERLPVMITPRWVQTRSQPVALDDALCALSGVLGRDEASARSTSSAARPR